MQFGGVFVEFCFAIPAVELVWKAMELLQLDEGSDAPCGALASRSAAQREAATGRREQERLRF